jgi:hypothetical protein
MQPRENDMAAKGFVLRTVKLGMLSIRVIATHVMIGNSDHDGIRRSSDPHQEPNEEQRGRGVYLNQLHVLRVIKNDQLDQNNI